MRETVLPQFMGEKAQQNRRSVTWQRKSASLDFIHIYFINDCVWRLSLADTADINTQKNISVKLFQGRPILF